MPTQLEDPHVPVALTAAEQAAIVKAAVFAHDGKHAEAEVARYAGGYHNLKEKLAW